MFAVSPRLTDEPDFGLLRMAEDLSRPLALFRPGALRLLDDAGFAGLRDVQVIDGDQEYRIQLNLGNAFKPEEVHITTDDKRIIVSAKHEEKQEKNCYVARSLTRVFTPPPGVDLKNTNSTMTKDGIVKIRAQKKALEEQQKERTIPVEYES